MCQCIHPPVTDTKIHSKMTVGVSLVLPFTIFQIVATRILVQNFGGLRSGWGCTCAVIISARVSWMASSIDGSHSGCGHWVQPEQLLLQVMYYFV